MKKKKKKNDRNLKNILWTHAIRTTTLSTSKFQPMPILWTHATHAIFFDPRQKFMDPRQPNQSLTQATHEPTLPTPPTLFSRLSVKWFLIIKPIGHGLFV